MHTIANGLITEHFYNIGIDVRVLEGHYLHPIVSGKTPLPAGVEANDCTIGYKAKYTSSTVDPSVSG
jgi:hypothetical protein